MTSRNIAVEVWKVYNREKVNGRAYRKFYKQVLFTIFTSAPNVLPHHGRGPTKTCTPDGYQGYNGNYCQYLCDVSVDGHLEKERHVYVYLAVFRNSCDLTF